jgi:hypothetical protein
MSKIILQFFLLLWCIVSSITSASALQPAASGVKEAPLTIHTTPVVLDLTQSPKSKQDLIKEKQVNQWSKKGQVKVKPNQIVPLTPQECSVLGGKISYWSSCESDVLCTVGSHVLCIDRMQK